jgi:hypothetical protein
MALVLLVSIDVVLGHLPMPLELLDDLVDVARPVAPSSSRGPSG